jgi:glycosyltransferase involved in cell wall biosynthesis
VIPTYQGEEFLAETLSTAISQTYPHIEIIISDDNSTDQTLQIAKEFQQQSPFPIKILTHHQLGMVNNWNFCINNSRGEYIKFLFQDDLLLPNCLEQMIDCAQKDPEIGLVFSARDLILAKGSEYDELCLNIYRDCGDLHQGWSNLQSVQSGIDLLRDPNLLEHPLNKIGEPSTVLIKREVFEKVGLFDPNLCQIVDVDMWFRIMTKYKIGYIDQKLSSFRIHGKQQSVVNADSGELILDNDRFNRKLLTHSCFQDLPQETKNKIYDRVMAYSEHKYEQLFRSKIDQIQELARNLEQELQLTQEALKQSNDNLNNAKCIIEAMESSKFWKLRNLWFKGKNLVKALVKERKINY